MKTDHLIQQSIAELMQVGLWSEAEKKWEELSAPLKRTGPILHLRGLLATQQNQLDRALEYFLKAVKAAPGQAHSFLSLGNVYVVKGEFERALAAYDQGIKVDHRMAELFMNRGTALRKLSRLEEGVKSYRKATAKKPSLIEAWQELAMTHIDLDQAELAQTTIHEAIRLDPQRAKSWHIQALVSFALHNPERAKDHLQRALQLDPNLTDARLALAEIYLEQQAFEEGWILYDARWRGFSRQVLRSLNRTEKPKYRGEPHLKRILVWSEQGLGDDLFFLNLIAASGSWGPELLVSIDPRLMNLLQRSIPSVQFISNEKPAEENAFDAHLPLGDLGLFLSAPSVIERRKQDPAFLKPSPERQNEIQSRLDFLEPGMKLCGLSWKSKGPLFGSHKSLSLETLLPLLKTEGYAFINLQYGEVTEEIEQLAATHGVKIHQVDGLDLHQDLEGLTALISLCDAVVTTSNVSAHFSGALGQKTCLLRSRSHRGSLWYWRMATDNHSPWYPSVEIFVQSTAKDWDEAIQGVSDRLEEWR